MQTEELKQSSEALQLQARELKNSVEQQKEMVKLSQHQFERELEKDRAREENESLNAQPIFDFVSSGPFSNSGGKVTYGFKLRNSGSSITEVNILLPSGYDLDCSKFNIWDSGVVKNFGLSFQNSNLNLELLFEISFVDGQHLNKKDEYILEVRGTGTDKLSWRKNG